jgi:hypothetical protein
MKGKLYLHDSPSSVLSYTFRFMFPSEKNILKLFCRMVMLYIKFSGFGSFVVTPLFTQGFLKTGW